MKYLLIFILFTAIAFSQSTKNLNDSTVVKIELIKSQIFSEQENIQKLERLSERVTQRKRGKSVDYSVKLDSSYKRLDSLQNLLKSKK